MTSRWPRIGDFWSLEFVFLLFLFAGAYKEALLLEQINRYADLTLLMTMIGMATGAISIIRRRQLPTNAQLGFGGAYFLLLLWATLSYCLSDIISEEATLKWHKLLVFNTWAVVGPLLVINTVDRVERLIRLFILYSSFAVFQALLGTQSADSAVFVGTFGTDHYHALGHAAGICMVISLGMVISEQKTFPRIIWIGLLSAALMAVFLSSTRQALVGMMPASAYLLYRLDRKLISPKTLLRWTVIVLAACGCFLAVKSSLLSHVNLDHVWERMLAVFDPGEEGREAFVNSERPLLWSSALSVWLSSPVIGVGWGLHPLLSESGMRHPHNFFVELLMELGLVGFVLGCLMLYAPARTMLRKQSVPRNPALVTIQGICIFSLSCAMFSGDITDNRVMFSFLALSLASTPASVRQRGSQVVAKVSSRRAAPMRTRMQLLPPIVTPNEAVHARDH